MRNILIKFQWSNIVFECALKAIDTKQIQNQLLHELDKTTLICEIDLIIGKIFPASRLIGVAEIEASSFAPSFKCQLENFEVEINAKFEDLEKLKYQIFYSQIIKLDKYNDHFPSKIFYINNQKCIINFNNPYVNLDGANKVIIANFLIKNLPVSVCFSLDGLHKLIFLFNPNIVFNDNDCNSLLLIEAALNIFILYLQLVDINAELLSWHSKTNKLHEMVPINITCGQISWFMFIDRSKKNFVVQIFDLLDEKSNSPEEKSVITTKTKLLYPVINILGNYSLEEINTLQVGDILLSNQLSNKLEDYINLGNTLLRVNPLAGEKLELISRGFAQ